VAVLLPHLGSEPYTLRSAVATCLASVVGAACEEDLRRRRLAENSSSSSDSVEYTEEQEETRREGGQLVRMEPHARGNAHKQTLCHVLQHCDCSAAMLAVVVQALVHIAVLLLCEQAIIAPL
jgi:hypothetical protein